MITCDDLLLDCQWKNQPVPCDQLFTPRITDNGICCGFNHLDPVLSTNNKTNAKYGALRVNSFEFRIFIGS
jgi:Amiloride-sensitive sodium channel